MPEIKDNPLILKDNESIITVGHKDKQLSYQLPFMVKTSFLKNTHFLAERKVPLGRWFFIHGFWKILFGCCDIKRK